MQVRVECGARVNYAMDQNEVRLVHTVTISNDGDHDLTDAVLTVRTEPSVTLPFERSLDAVRAHSEVVLRDVDVRLDTAALAQRTERERGLLVVELRGPAATETAPLDADADAEPLVRRELPLEVLARNEWPGDAAPPELLAAFVVPNDPGIAELLRSASDVQRARGWRDTLEGYQSGSRARVLELTGAVYGAICDRDLRYAVPPASFERSGQKVRLPSDVLSSGLATCLDTTLLFAGCLEQAGLHPVLVLLREHAFVGVWLDDTSYPDVASDSRSGLVNRIDLDRIAVFETTVVTAEHPPTFAEARRAARSRLEGDEFLFVVDVHAARQARVRPVTTRSVEGDDDAGRSGRRTAAPTDDLGRVRGPLVVADEDDVGTAARVERWKAELLDLTFRNSLLAFRETNGTLPLRVPDLAEFEDVLSEGARISLRTEEGLGGLAEGSEPDDDRLRRELAAKRVVVPVSQTELEKRALQIYRDARSALEESGSNVLYLALGMLHWYESPASEKLRRSPLLLLPLEITRRSVSSGFRIRLMDADPRFNVTLLQKLERDFGLRIPGVEPLPEDDRGVDVDAVLAAVRHAILEHDRWTVAKEAWIGRFSFQKFLMWLDLEEHADRLAKNPVVRRLMGRGDGPGDVRHDLPRAERLDDETRPHDFLCPLDADSSQLAAVRAAAEGTSFVLQGPPGTGKSQTITNLIAHCLGTGQRVLFVSEKRAALEVVLRRLERVGLAPFALALHSNKANKRSVLDQIEAALDVSERRSPAEWERRGEELARLRARLNDYCDALHRDRPAGLTVHDGLTRLMDLRDAPDVEPELRSPERLRATDLDDLQRLARDLAGGAREARLRADHPLASVSVERWTVDLPERVRVAGATLCEAVRSLAEALATSCEELELEPASQPLDTVCESVEALRELLARTPCPPSSLLRCTDLSTVAGDLRQWLQKGEERDALEAELRDRYTDAFWDLPHAELAREIDSAQRAMLLLRWWRLRSLRARLAAALRGARPPDEQLFGDPGRALELAERTRELEQRATLAAERFGDAWRIDAGRWGELERALDWAVEFHALVARIGGADLDRRQRLRERWCSLATEGADLVRAGGVVEERAAQVAAHRAEFDTARTAWSELTGASHVGDSGAADAWLTQFREEVERVVGAAAELRSWAEWCRARTAATARGLGPVVAAMEDGSVTPEQVERAVWRGVLSVWTRASAAAEPALAEFHGSRHRGLVEEFRRKDRDLARLAREVVLARLAARVPRGAPESVGEDSEMGIIRRELRKKSRHRPIRRLIEETSHVLARIKPCFLMSPLSIAQYLPPDAEPFDLVVFDEASQIPVCDGIGAIARGAHVVVVGDSKQLPPTRFFSSQDADEPDPDELYDLESILDECLAAQLPVSSLGWHYRSRHEHLITFSNQRYYGGRLHTFPSSEYEGSRLGVEWHHVPDGVYDRGASSTNRGEARALVEYLVRHFSDPATRERSVGVVTFSSQQQRCVEDLLEVARREHDAIEPYFADARDEPVFVKNLESVQGDERDVILFSVGYGPDAAGKVTMNFGPLNRAGGERRLNVAVTRARERVEVFSTLRPEQIDLRRTRAEGVRDLKTFLEYAQRGPVAILAESLAPHDARPESPFEEEVYDALRTAGFDVHPQVGCSGYRIDLGVVHPEQPGRYVLGVECDGAMYHSAKTARDRDRVRAAVLEGLGWRLHRIWSTDWWLEPEKETGRVVDAIRAAIQAATATDSLPAAGPPAAGPSPVPSPLPDAVREVPSATPDLGAAEPTESGPAARRFASASSVATDRPAGPPCYVVHDFGGEVRDAARFYEEGHEPELRDALRAVVRTEAPILRDLLYRRVLGLYELNQLGSRIRRVLDAALEACPHVVVRSDEGDGDVVYPEGEDEAPVVGYRVPDPDDPRTERAVDEIPVCELAPAVADVLRSEVRMAEDALLRQAARRFGVSRLGRRVRERLSLAVDHLERRGRVRRDSDWVTLSD